MERLFYKKLLDWKNNDKKKPFMLLGARQVGKTYLIEEFCKNEYKYHETINLLERKDIVSLYNMNINSEEKFLKLKSLLKINIEEENSILFIDEIQESENLISELKYFCEKHNNINIICAGSLLGVKLRRISSSFPVGKVVIDTLYPMNFEEFLIANGEESLMNDIRKAFETNTELIEIFHHRACELFKLYLISGGMPENVSEIIRCEKDITKLDKNISESILQSYFNDMDRYVSNSAERIKIEKIYRSIPSQLGNQSKKFQYSKIEKDARSREYETALDWLLTSNIVLQSFSVSTPQIPLKPFEKDDQFKIYLNDVGLLCNLSKINYSDILLGNIGFFSGPLTENYVACELVSMGYSLNYWKSEATSEVDFLLYKDSKIIPLEVKASTNVKSKSLDVYKEKYNPEISYRISLRNFGYDKEKRIKSVPLYALYCLK